MTSTLSAATGGNSKYSTPILLILIAAGLAGNYLKYTIFLNIDFLFGSIFAMLALQFFGLGRGILAAAGIAAYTYILWNHPYAIIVMTVEVAAVGWLIARSRIGLVMADALYWLLIGMPLIYLFYHVVMHVPLGNIYIVMTKQSVNGITNALIARLIFTGYALRSRSTHMAYSEIIYNLLAFFVLVPALIMLAIGSRTDFTETDHRIRTSLILDRERFSLRLETWGVNRKHSILNLAEMAASKSPQQMQDSLEQAKRSDVNLLRVGLTDKEATSIAFYPLVDEMGKSTIGVSFAERPYVPVLKRTLKPMLSEVIMGKVGIIKPRVLILAPVLIDGNFSGYVFGVLDLTQIREYLDKSVGENSALYTLLDKNGTIIMTNRADQSVMAPFVRGKGTLTPLGKGISQWVPAMDPNTPASERWRKSLYVTEAAIGDLAEWKLVLEQPMAPFQSLLYNNYTGKLTMLFLILFVALALAELLSRRFIVTLEKLRLITHDLPGRLAAGNKEIAWPESSIHETNHLIHNFREMAESLSGQFHEIRHSNETLEVRVVERTAELRASEERFRSLMENIPDVAVQGFAPDGTVLFWNRASELLYGYSAEEALGSNLLTLIIPQETRESVAEAIRQMAQSGQAIPPGELILQRKNGTRVAVFSSHALVVPDNRQPELFCLDIDLTERKKAENELCQAKEAAEAANTAKSQFLANMSHEIRTPMNGVIGLTELLLGTELSEEQREYAELVKLSGRSLVQLISDILDLSKIEARKIELDIRDIHLYAEITGTINLLSPRAREKGLQLGFLIDPDVPLFLKGDAGRLRQIITNLVGNAIKFTDRGLVSLQVRTEAEDDQRTTLHFQVRDSGVGIAPDKLETIFSPFTQADGSTTRKFGGTGLGLTISRQLAELMGGTVGVESVEGEGSTFWFTAVLEKQADGPPRIADLTIAPDESGPEKVELGDAAIRLLLVEDDSTNQRVTRSILVRCGYQVDVAGNGREAVALLERNDYALVMMDCMMPVMDGFEATAVIRNQASAVRNHAIPVIALTANAMREDHAGCLAAGMDDYLSKPLDSGELLALLEKWLSFGSTRGAATQEVIPVEDVKRDTVFDRDEFVRRNCEDLELSRDVAAIFIDHRSEYTKSIRIAVAACDNTELRRAAHKLKGAAVNLSLPLLAETAATIESAAVAGDQEIARQLLPELEVRFEQGVEAIRDLLISPLEKGTVTE